MDSPRTRPAPPRVLKPALVVAMTVGMLALTTFLALTFFDRPTALAGLTLPWWALALGFVATETWVVHLQVDREGQVVALSELPLVLGLFFASPLQLVLGRLVGSLVVMVLRRRTPPLKILWNLAHVTLHTAVTLSLFGLIGGGRGAASVLAWAGAYAGLIGANAVGAVALALVVAIYEGGLSPRQVARDIVFGDLASPVVVTLGLVAVTSLAYSPRTAGLLLLTGAGLIAGYRLYAALADRHLGLERLYRFTQAMSSSPEMDQVLGQVLAQAREVLHAERAEIAFVSAATGDVAHVRLGATGRLSHSDEPRTAEEEWLLSQVVSGERVLLSRGTRELPERRWLEAQAARDAVAVPLQGAAGVLGALVVSDRLGDIRTFTADDVLLLETVATQAQVTLQNGELLHQLRHEASHDRLTGLPNRGVLQSQLAAALEELAEGRSSGAAVMILDLNGFREVNDTLGHEQGDAVLVEVGRRLRAAVDPSGTVARLGGDEFAVLLRTGDEEAAVRVGRTVLRVLERPIALDQVEIEVGGSLGIALAPAHASEPAALLKRADIAMSDAKASVGRLRVFEPDLDSDDPRRLLLVSELRSALNLGQLEVHVQPQARTTTGATVSVEALARWHHPDLGAIPPDEFIPIAERSGLVGALTTQVLDRSLAAVAGWSRHGHDLSIAVNLSTRSLHDADLVEEVARLLGRHGVLASRLTLEVTESSVMADPARAIAVLQQLRGLGVRLSVDDFGTGYSSLSYLKSLPVHEIKIDRSFIMGLATQTEDVAIVRAIVDLGRHLGLEVVAEGVEDQPTWDLLAEMGCDLVQGWHLGRPMPIVDLSPWLGSRGEPTELHAV